MCYTVCCGFAVEVCGVRGGKTNNLGGVVHVTWNNRRMGWMRRLKIKITNKKNKKKTEVLNILYALLRRPYLQLIQC